jgi:hypothetical protein
VPKVLVFASPAVTMLFPYYFSMRVACGLARRAGSGSFLMADALARRPVVRPPVAGAGQGYERPDDGSSDLPRPSLVCVTSMTKSATKDLNSTIEGTSISNAM